MAKSSSHNKKLKSQFKKLKYGEVPEPVSGKETKRPRLTKKEVAKSKEKQALKRQCMRQACLEIIAGSKTKKAAMEEYGIPSSTLSNWLRNGLYRLPDNQVKTGRAPLLPADTEQMLAAFIGGSALQGVPLRVNVVKLYMRHLIVLHHGIDKVPTCLREYFRGFLARNAHLVSQKCEGELGCVLKVRKCPEGLSKHRALCMTETNVIGYQDNCIKPLLQRRPEFTLAHVGGFDEFQFNVNSAIQGGNVVTPNGLLYTITPQERDEHMTVLAGYVGTWATPILVIFKGVQLDLAWLQLLPENDDMLMVAVSSNGWITPELKVQWYKAVRNHPKFPFPNDPVLWQFDGHYTNTTPEFLLTAKRWFSSRANSCPQTTPIPFADSIDDTDAPSNTDLHIMTGADGMRSFVPSAQLNPNETWEGDELSCYPPHATHGMQAMDTKMGPIQKCKNNLQPLLTQQFLSKGSLGKPELLYVMYVAMFGGKHDAEACASLDVQAAMSPDIIKRSLAQVGWHNDKNGKLVYAPLDVIDVRKYLPSKTYTKPAHTLGPTEPEPKVENDRTRSAPLKYFNIEDISATHSQMLTANALSARVPSIAPPRTGQGPRIKDRAYQQASGWVFNQQKFMRDQVAADKENAEAAQKKQKLATDRAEAVEDARKKCEHELSMVMSNPGSVMSLSGTKAEEILRVMGQKLSGSAEDKKARVRDNMAAYVAKMTSPAQVVVGVVVPGSLSTIN